MTRHARTPRGESGPLRRGRLRRATTAAASVLATLAGLVLLGAPGVAATGCPGVAADGRWTTIAKPPDAGQLTSHAADRFDASRLLVTDGVSLWATGDGGCSWETLFSLPAEPSAERPFARDLARITHVALPSRAGDDTIYLALAELNTDATRFSPNYGVPRLLASEDGGRSWESRGTGLAHALVAKQLAVSPADPDTVYVVTGDQTLWGSDDGGRTFTPRTTGVSQFAADPLGAARTWAVLAGDSHDPGIFRSADGGRTWEERPTGAEHGSAEGLAVVDDGEQRARVIGAVQRYNNSSLKALVASRDAGATFERIEGTGLVGSWNSVGAVPGAERVVVATDNDEGRSSSRYSVYAYDPEQGRFEDVDDLRLSNVAPLEDVIALRVRRPTYVFRQPERLAIFRDAAGASEDGTGSDEEDDGSDRDEGDGEGAGFFFDPPPTSPPAEARLSPAQTGVAPPPGERRRLDYRLELPRRPTPLDVFLLVDASASLTAEQRALRDALRRIVGDIARAGVDARFGLASFSAPECHRYKRLRDLGPPDREFQEEVGRFQPHSCGGQEVHYTALHQAATGSGIAGVTAGPLALLRPVEPGQQASFRAGGLPVIVHLTDEPPSPDPQGPTPDEAIAALRDRGVRQVGLAGDHDGQQPVVRAFLDDIARRTGAVAAAGGVDCDGDGAAERGEGEPITCLLPAQGDRTAMGTAIVNGLLALRDEQTVRLRATEGDDLVAAVEPGAREQVDVKRDHVGDRALPFAVSYRCPTGRLGDEHPVRLEATVGERVVATATAVVDCGKGKASTGPPGGGGAPSGGGASAGGGAPASTPASSPAGEPASSTQPATGKQPATGLPAAPGGGGGSPAAALAPPPPAPPAPIAVGAPGSAQAPATAGSAAGAGSAASAGSGSSAASPSSAAAGAPAAQQAPGSTGAAGPQGAVAAARRRSSAPGLRTATVDAGARSAADHAMVATRQPDPRVPLAGATGLMTLAAAWLAWGRAPGGPLPRTARVRARARGPAPRR